MNGFLSLSIAPATSPRSCHAMTINSTAINVTWLVPATPNGLIQYYTVTYRPMQYLSGQDVFSTQPTTYPTTDNTTQQVLASLLKATSYSFTITAYTVVGPGPSSTNQCVAYTQEDGEYILKAEGVLIILLVHALFAAVPSGPPLSIQATADTAFSMSVSWSPPDMEVQNGRIIRYKLLYTTDSSQQVDLRPTIVVNGTTLSHRLTNLQANTRYYISVAAATKIGFGPFATTSAVTLKIGKLSIAEFYVNSRPI